MAVPAYLLAGWGIADNIDAVIIGAAMILVPGLLITNSMRDLIYGDTNSGINRIVQVFLTAFAIALGTAAAWHVTAGVYGQTVSAVSVSYPVWAQCLAVLVGSVGFSILFNIHGWGSWLCIIASVMTWTVYLLAQRFGCDIYGMCLFATIFAATYAEIMARIRKYPVTSYLIVAIFTLMPGSGIYYTMRLGVEGNMQAALAKGLETAGIAGSIAVGILLVSTVSRLLRVWRGQKRARVRAGK